MSDLRLRDVRKTFPGGATAVHSVDLRFPAGELTALLGPSGCGKTTLLRIIAGLEAPSFGRIELGGEDVTDLPAHERRFGMVFQSFALFPHLSVAENVGYSLAIAGRPKPERRARAFELLDLVQLSGLGERRIGELSGGQRQRVAIARAIVADPPILVFDEATSHVDNETELVLQEKLDELTRNRTTFVVAHRLSTVRGADRILVLEDGAIVEEGTHEALVDQGGTYATLWNVQVGNLDALSP